MRGGLPIREAAVACDPRSLLLEGIAVARQAWSEEIRPKDASTGMPQISFELTHGAEWLRPACTGHYRQDGGSSWSHIARPFIELGGKPRAELDR